MYHKLKIFLVFIASISMYFPSFSQPDNNEQLAIQYFQNKEYDKAVILFEDIYERTPTLFIYNYYVNCLLELKDYRKAEKFISRLNKKNPDIFSYAVDLGYIYQLEGDYEKAKKQFENTIKSVNSYKDQFIGLANAFLVRDLSDYAIKTYEQGQKTLKNFYNFNLELADAYLKKNNFSSALNQYLDYVSSYPDETDMVQGKMQDLLLTYPDDSRKETFKSSLLQRIKKEPDIKSYPILLLWFFIQQKEFGAAFIQAKAIDKRFNEDGERVIELARIAAANTFYDEAISCYDYILSQKNMYSPYYQAALVEKLNTRYQKVTENIIINKDETLQLENEYLDLIQKTGQTNYSLQLIKNLAHLQAFYMDKTPEATQLLQDAIQYKGVTADLLAQCKVELADILLLTGEVWEASLLYSQVEKAFKNDVIGFEAKYRNAKLYFYIGEFEFAKAQLDILKAATAKLISNDAMELSLLIGENYDEDSSTVGLQLYSRADLLLFQNKYEQALTTLDSINTLGLYHPLFDEVLYKKAQIKIKQKQYSEADSLLNKLVDFYSADILADDALFLLGQLNERQFKNTEKAMENYERIFTDYQGSIYVVDARKRYRALRGDKIN